MPRDALISPTAVLLPVKSFTQAKLRLASALDHHARADLARSMATHVVAAASPLSVAVVCDDVEVAAWARDNHALVIWEPERGLNRAVEAGVGRLGEYGATRVVVAHSDLLWATRLGWIGRFGGVTIVPDHRDNGSNVVCVPTDVPFTFSYGPGSFLRHAAEAHRLRLPLRVVREPALGRDVDLPADLAGMPTVAAHL